MRFRRCVLTIFLIWLATPAHARAQTSRPELDGRWQVSVMTFGPGQAIYERYGHCALRLRNDTRRFDVCYDWGNFDFLEPNFIGRFLAGTLEYSMQGKETSRVLAAYVDREDRSVTEQALDLTPAQVDRLIARVAAQDNDVDRFYRYDYFRDNCSTRIRDLIDDATDGALRRTLDRPVAPTLRWHNRRVSAVGPVNGLLCVLMDFTMGPRVDAAMLRWDETFIPTTLADALDEVRLSGDGSDRALVSSRRQVHLTNTAEHLEPARPPRLVAWTLPVGAIGGVLLVGLARSTPRGFRVLASAWALFAGLNGCFLIGMWALTGHWATGWNQNVLQFTPLSLVVLAALWTRRGRRLAANAAVVVAGLSAAGALVTLAHVARQVNAPAVALALPLHLAVAYGARRLARVADEAAAIDPTLIESNAARMPS